MEREVGGGIGMGNACKPMAVSFQCMTKPTTIKKLKKKEQLILNLNSSSEPTPIPLAWDTECLLGGESSLILVG